MSKKLISVVLLLATPVALGDHAPTIISGDRPLIRGNSPGAPLAGGIVQSNLAQPDFSLSATPSFQSTTPGNSASYGMNIAPLAATTGFYSNVELSVTGLPPGGTATFTPNAIQASGSSTLSVATSSTTPVGNYTLTVTATTGRITHVTQVTLVVSDFSISVTPPSRSIGQGSRTSFAVSIKPVGSLMATINFAVTGLPPGTHSAFTPASVNNSGTSTLTILSQKSSPIGTYVLKIHCRGAGVTHSADATLTIK